MVKNIHLATPFTEESMQSILQGDSTVEGSIALRFIKMDHIARRYAPMIRGHIPGFPNKMPKVDWSKNFPVFKNVEGNDAALHLVKFHMHVRILKIDFPEDCVMKIFMATLEGEAQPWYESLSLSCIIV